MGQMVQPIEIELHEKKNSNNTKQSSKDAKDSIN